MATIQVVLTNGTTADADQVMLDFDEIYANIDNSNIKAAAGIVFSKLDSVTVAGVAASQNLTNKTLTTPVFAGSITGTYTLAGTPTISGPTLSGSVIGTYTLAGTPTLSGTFAGTPTFSGLCTFTNGITISTTKQLNFNVGATTYIYEASAGVVPFIAGGQTYWQAQGSSNRFDFGTNIDVAITGTKKWILASGTNNYFQNTSDGVNLLVSAGTTVLKTETDTTVTFPTGLNVGAGTAVRLDGDGGNDYWQNTSNGVNILVAGGTTALTTNSAGEILLANVDPPTANYTNRNGNIKASALISVAFTGGYAAAIVTSYNISSVSIDAGGTVLTINWNTDFASANYVVNITMGPQMRIPTGIKQLYVSGQAAGSITIEDTGGAQLCIPTNPTVGYYNITAIGTQ